MTIGVSVERQQDLTDADTVLEASPERFCAVTRTHADPADLIRFVLSPDGAVVPDLERRLPGRGVWVGLNKALVEKAAKANVFARSLKTRADVTLDLADRVDALLVKRLSATLAFANKAGLVTAGFEKVMAAIDKNLVAAIVHGSEAAEDGRSKIDRKFKAVRGASGKDAPIIDLLGVDQISLAIGRGSVVHAGLASGGLTARFLEEAARLRRYRATSPDAIGEFSGSRANEGGTDIA